MSFLDHILRFQIFSSQVLEEATIYLDSQFLQSRLKSHPLRILDVELTILLRNLPFIFLGFDFQTSTFYQYQRVADGQRYRYRIARLIESGRQYWVMDEFCATLDRETAKIVAFNVQKQARRTGKAMIAATTHTDLFRDLAPSVHIHKRFGKEIEVHYFPNEINKTCSLTREMHVAEGSIEDYHKLSGFHYRDSRRVAAVYKVFVLKRGDELCGVILYKYLGITCQGRREAIGRVLTIQELN